MATKKVKWKQKTGAGTFDVLHPETEVSQIVDFPSIHNYVAGTGVSISSSYVISTTAASSSASGHVTTDSQTFAGRKTFNGGINIPSGATIQLGGSSGTSGDVLTSNGTSSNPSWTSLSSYAKLDRTNQIFTGSNTFQTPIQVGRISGQKSMYSGTNITFDDQYVLSFPKKSGTLATLDDVSGRGGTALDYFRVGYVYISYTDTSPASMFGGSWTSITGRFPYFNASTSVGGSSTHTLSLLEMPSHKHGVLVDLRQKKTSIGNDYGPTGTQLMTSNGTPTVEDNTFARTSNMGGGESFSIMPPYQSFYAWRRTA